MHSLFQLDKDQAISIQSDKLLDDSELFFGKLLFTNIDLQLMPIKGLNGISFVFEKCKMLKDL